MTGTVPEYNGWPTLNSGTYLRDLDAYAQALAAKLFAKIGTGPVTPGQPALDTGWVDVTVNSGYSAITTNERPQVRRIGPVVYMRGGWSSTGITANASHTLGVLQASITVGGTVVQLRPNVNDIRPVGGSSGAALGAGFVSADGTVSVRTSATVSSYYKFDRAWVI